jgi:hypothetical protein
MDVLTLFPGMFAPVMAAMGIQCTCFAVLYPHCFRYGVSLPTISS